MTKKTYAELRRELDALLEWFDQEELDVDAAISKYEEAIRLTKQLEKYLSEAENKIVSLKNS